MKIVKRVVVALVALVALGALALLGRFYLMLPNVRAAQNLTAPSSPEAIERGRYLVHHVAGCVGCHSKVDTSKPGEPMVDGFVGAGRDFGTMEGFPGHVRAANITSDPETGIGSWSDGEIVRAMREGVSKDGRPLFPMMPYTTYARSLSDEDALAIVAYLRTLAPIKNDPGRTTIDFPVSMFVRAAPKPVDKVAGPAPAQGLERGKWLLDVAMCRDCHDTMDARRNPIPGKSLAGGTPMPIEGKGLIYSANITSDPTTGIGAYSDEDLMRVLSEGIGKAGRPLYGMPWPYYKGMTEADKRALIAALRTVPPVVNVVPPPTFQP